MSTRNFQTSYMATQPVGQRSMPSLKMPTSTHSGSESMINMNKVPHIALGLSIVVLILAMIIYAAIMSRKIKRCQDANKNRAVSSGNKIFSSVGSGVLPKGYMGLKFHSAGGTYFLGQQNSSSSSTPSLLMTTNQGEAARLGFTYGSPPDGIFPEAITAVAKDANSDIHVTYVTIDSIIGSNQYSPVSTSNNGLDFATYDSDNPTYFAFLSTTTSPAGAFLLVVGKNSGGDAGMVQKSSTNDFAITKIPSPLTSSVVLQHMSGNGSSMACLTFPMND